METLLTFIFLLNYFLNSVKNILNLVKNTEESKIAYKRIIDIINYEVKKKKDKNKHTHKMMIEVVMIPPVFERLCFGLTILTSVERFLK